MKRAPSLSALLIGGLIITLVSLSVAAAGNSYYRWIDDRGNPVHSDRPPAENIEYEIISNGSRSLRKVAPKTEAAPAQVKPQAQNTADIEAVKTAADDLQVTPKNPEFCTLAQENLNALSTSARIKIRDENGEYRILDQDEQEAQRQKARDAIAVHCD